MSLARKVFLKRKILIKKSWYICKDNRIQILIFLFISFHSSFLFVSNDINTRSVYKYFFAYIIEEIAFSACIVRADNLPYLACRLSTPKKVWKISTRGRHYLEIRRFLLFLSFSCSFWSWHVESEWQMVNRRTRSEPEIKK